jgi:hypothetical protein
MHPRPTLRSPQHHDIQANTQLKRRKPKLASNRMNAGSRRGRAVRWGRSIV